MIRVIFALFCTDFVLLGQMNTTGNTSFKEHDFGMAVTRYVQVGNLLKDTRAVRPEEDAMIDALDLKATRNLTLAALKNWEWSRARRACDKVTRLELYSVMLLSVFHCCLFWQRPQFLAATGGTDLLVCLRRAEANRELGRYEPAYADIALILETNISPVDPIARKAQRIREEMRRAEKLSNDELRGPLAKGLSSSIFSSDRPASTGGSRNSANGFPEENTRLQRLRATRENKERHNTAPKQTGSALEKLTTVPRSQAARRRLELGAVKAIQEKQSAIFQAPKVQYELDKMRMDADLEQARFVYRLQPFKLEVQRELLCEYGFEPSKEGLSSMERAIAAHMSDAPEVGARGKELMLGIMGDIWAA